MKNANRKMVRGIAVPPLPGLRSSVGLHVRRLCVTTTRPPGGLRIASVNDCYELHNLPRLRALIEHRRREQAASTSDAVFLSTVNGDFVSPSILSGMDGGRGMVSVLNHVGVSHVCLGNHEADVRHLLPRPPCVPAPYPCLAAGLLAHPEVDGSISSPQIKLNELTSRIQEFGGVWLNSNLPKFESHAVPYDLVRVPASDGAFVNVGLLGLLSSEPGVFRHNKFRGIPIDDVVEAAERWGRTLREEHGAIAIIALTHQSISADEALAASGHVDLILGGHEHEVLPSHSPTLPPSHPHTLPPAHPHTRTLAHPCDTSHPHPHPSP